MLTEALSNFFRLQLVRQRVRKAPVPKQKKKKINKIGVAVKPSAWHGLAWWHTQLESLVSERCQSQDPERARLRSRCVAVWVPLQQREQLHCILGKGRLLI